MVFRPERGSVGHVPVKPLRALLASAFFGIFNAGAHRRARISKSGADDTSGSRPKTMKSEINEKLTEREREVLRLYRNPEASDLGRQIRLSVQYAVGAGIFLGLALWRNQPLYAIVVYVVFVLWMLIRIQRARALAGVMPRIIEKYESEVKELKANTKPEADNGM